MTSSRDASSDSDVDFRLEQSARAPGSARGKAGAWLDSLHVHPSLRHDVLIAVSELVTNAVTHAASAPRVQLIQHDGHLRLEVHDASPEQPVRQRGSADGGFGIQLIAELAETWGWALSDDGGKVVWAEFDARRTHSALDDAADSER